MVGAKLVFPAPRLDGKSLYELFESERRHLSAGVPTVWLGLLSHVKHNDLKFSTMQPHGDRRLGLPAGDDAHASRTSYGVEVLHAWGMTEMSPLGTLCNAEGQARARSTPSAAPGCRPSRAARSSAST